MPSPASRGRGDPPTSPSGGRCQPERCVPAACTLMHEVILHSRANFAQRLRQFCVQNRTNLCAKIVQTLPVFARNYVQNCGKLYRIFVQKSCKYYHNFARNFVQKKRKVTRFSSENRVTLRIFHTKLRANCGKIYRIFAHDFIQKSCKV